MNKPLKLRITTAGGRYFMVGSYEPHPLANGPIDAEKRAYIMARRARFTEIENYLNANVSLTTLQTATVAARHALRQAASTTALLSHDDAEAAQIEL